MGQDQAAESAAQSGFRDMPADVLDGWLGEVCRIGMDDFPIAYAWTALLTVASAMIERRAIPVNLYGALVGPVGSGKSQAIQRAARLLGIQSPALMQLMAGSAEGLLTSEAIEGALGAGRLLAPDELGHLLEKSRIDNSSFPYLLNTAFYSNGFQVKMAKGRKADFACWLSIIGGLVEERFEDLFGSNATGGLYDRFIYGLCPTGFGFVFTNQEVLDVLSGNEAPKRPVFTQIDPSVWEVTAEWKKNLPGRAVELAVRAAAVCAAFDRRSVLRADDLKPALAFAEYQSRFREYLKPNPGKNFEAVLQYKFLAYLRREPGQWFGVREMFRDTRAYDFSLTTANRALAALVFNGDVELQKEGRKQFARITTAAQTVS
jgi:hypothetical protein